MYDPILYNMYDQDAYISNFISAHLRMPQWVHSGHYTSEGKRMFCRPSIEMVSNYAQKIANAKKKVGAGEMDKLDQTIALAS